MGILSFFRNRRDTSPSAAVAKGRLQVLIAHERTNRNGPEYLPQLKQDIVDVIKKYVNVGEDQVMVKIDSQDNREVLELNITLPEDAKEAVDASVAAASTNTEASSAQPGANGDGNASQGESSNAPDGAKAAASVTNASSQNSKSNGKKSSRSSGKKNKGNKKSRRK